MTPLTGDDIARLHLIADANLCTWANNSKELDVPYRVDEDRRCVYVNGRLDVVSYFEALTEGLDEIIRNLDADPTNIIPFRHRHTG